jgi:hypothetical protein
MKPKTNQRQATEAITASDLGKPETSLTLLTPQQLAQRLNVPCTWVREKTRKRARLRDENPLPTKRLGKYTRFSWPEVEAWLLRQGN